MGLYECLEGEKGGANDGIIIKNKWQESLLEFKTSQFR